ncbi:hypothetical protein GCM10022245_76850 [Streptomyces mayteni]
MTGVTDPTEPSGIGGRRSRRPRRGGAAGRAVPLYIVTGGRSESGDDLDSLLLDLVTLVVARSTAPDAGHSPEHAALLRVCQHPISVAEISAHLGLPFSAVTVLLKDLRADGLVELRHTREAQRQAAADPDIETLKALIDGLQRL